MARRNAKSFFHCGTMNPGDRDQSLRELTSDRLDVLVVGGGIVGAGVARDAALRGLRVGLVEQYDFAAGTSSRSSRLLHGGLRYLAQGRLGLVHEASREKCVLGKIAPHLTAPLAFVFPTYRGTPWRRWQLAVGVKLYDLLCGGRNFGPSQAMSATGMMAHLPGLNPQRLTGGVRYFDALTNDARLVLDTLRSAAQAGAIVRNYTRLCAAEPRGELWQCTIAETLGDPSAAAARLVLARAVVNATGPWAPSLPHSGVRLRLTKGVHLVVARARFDVPDAVVMAKGRRILFAIPWGERTILGTTDTDFDGPIEAVRTEPDDVRYVLAVVNAAFPTAGLVPADVRATWAGLRPLIAARGGGPSDISRTHQIAMPMPGWIDVAGGKLTTYRLIAEQTVERVVRYLGVQAGPCRTAQQPLLPGGASDPFSGILPPPMDHAAVRHFCEHEWAVRLDDVLRRRTSWQYYRDDISDVAHQVADWMSALHDWDAARRAAELAFSAASGGSMI